MSVESAEVGLVLNPLYLCESRSTFNSELDVVNLILIELGCIAELKFKTKNFRAGYFAKVELLSKRSRT